MIILPLLLCLILIAIIIYLQNMVRVYSYWKKRGVVGPKPYPIVGNYKTVIFGQEAEGDLLKKIYEQYPNEKFVGLYKGVRPVLLIRDPELIKCVLIKDFDYFTDRCLEKPVQVFNKSIFVMRGDSQWQATRLTQSPNFTKSKVDKMIPYAQKAADDYLNFIDDSLTKNIEHDLHELKCKYIIQIIGYLFFGVNHGGIDGNTELMNAFNALLDPQLQSSPIHTAAYLCPAIVDMLTPTIRREFDRKFVKKFRIFLTSLINMPREKKSLSPILIETLIDLKEKSKIRNGPGMPDIDDEFILQQILTYSTATYESTPTLLSFMMYELALNQDIQDKCYKEVMTVLEKYNGELTSEAMSEMKYLEMTIDETSRIHPAAHCIDRKCVSKYTFPNTNVTIDEKIFIFMPSHGLSRDPKYFTNPNEFYPERFSLENKVNIQPYVFFPFGDGPRKCLGVRLAKVLIVTCVATFLQKYKVSPSAKTKPVKYDPAKLLAVSPLGGLWVKIEPRN